MKNTNHNDEFEQLLKSEADNHKMYPSEMVWENIRTSIHGNKSWNALTFMALLIIVSLTIITLYNYPPENILAKANPLKSNSLHQQKTIGADNIEPASKEDFATQINPNRFTEQTIQTVNANLEMAGLIDDNIIYTPEKTTIDLQNSNNQLITASVPTKKIFISNTYSIAEENNNTNITDYSNDEPDNTVETATITNTKKNNHFDIKESIANENGNNSVDDYLNTFGVTPKNKKLGLSKWSLQLYATPSISYRKLDDELPQSLTISNGASNVNNSVQHKPALGFELGAGFAYNLTPSFKLKTGLQFNIRQYYIDANKSFGLATFAFVQNNHLDSITLFSAFSNINTANVIGGSSYLSTKLDNKLYQISIPIGFEWNFIKGKKLGVSVGATIQPTFTLNKSLYMISTDYKYYADGESFFRKWNYNSSAELIFNYKLSNNTTLFFGPQIRYQHLPTYNDVYSIKEHRLDYGFKIGITKPL